MEDPRRFLFYEKYDDRAALDAHRVAPYFAEYITNGLAKIAENRVAEMFAPIQD